jgi:putative ABC transport system permease protein
MRQGFVLVSAGVIVGGGASLFVTRLLKGVLFGVTPADPLTFASAGILISAAALIACWLPARRAARVDPMVALRAE